MYWEQIQRVSKITQLLLSLTNTSFRLVLTESNFPAFSLLKWSLDFFCVHVTNLLVESPCQDIYCNTRSYTCLQTLIAYLEKYTHTFSEALGVCSEMPRWRAGREQLSPKTQHRAIDLKLGEKKCLHVRLLDQWPLWRYFHGAPGAGLSLFCPTAGEGLCWPR